MLSFIGIDQQWHRPLVAANWIQNGSVAIGENPFTGVRMPEPPIEKFEIYGHGNLCHQWQPLESAAVHFPVAGLHVVVAIGIEINDSLHRRDRRFHIVERTIRDFRDVALARICAGRPGCR